MHWKLVFNIIRWLITVSAGIAVLVLCIHTYSYYEENREAILLGVYEHLETILLPIEMAKLVSEPQVTSIPVPVHGIRFTEIADTWGAARSEGRTHEGVDIFTERGTPVYAGARGFVVRTGTNNLGGNIVFTMGPGGVRYYYAHLESIADGMSFGTPVTTDTVVGFVGSSGNAEDTPPHLHFGMYEQGPQNPYPLLIDRY